jgi:hypothetical protein
LKESYHVSAFDGAFDSDACGFRGHVSLLASQPKLGVWTERRAGIDCRNPARPAVAETLLSVKRPEGEGKDNMRTLFAVVVALLVGIVVLGFARGWFQFSTDTANQSSSATITVDKDKIHEDEQKAKARVQNLGQAANNSVGDQTGKQPQPERQP